MKELALVLLVMVLAGAVVSAHRQATHVTALGDEFAALPFPDADPDEAVTR